MSDLSKIKKFLDDDYRASYLDSHVKGSVAYQIQALREELGLNQTAFGALVGMPQSVISRLENAEGGSVNVNTLLKIAHGLKIGLAIKFCGFDSILAEDVTPVGLSVENIQSTIDRLALAKPLAPQSTVVVVTATKYPALESNRTWQTSSLPNQPSASIQRFPGSGTPSSGTFMLTQVTPA
ncbi:helix-turn-helix domain-containing protein [Bradyrhizobium quebecense]|uniref:Helix-turn-helix transcriptional regulator n=1 Tax=Bradyrhizobium quebecense TaxID=2748629 RepID=A0A974AD90_9BRAD|nr:helix-turn-helix transcriptional regulator [Bradyrhizobium quebecense]UGA47228.1 helix-turn-helix domain-containing protein [Bradyrhizobium quebecense]